MKSFSVLPYQHESILDCYKQWITCDLYRSYMIEDINDPSFLQKLSILQAENIRHDIALHSEVTSESISNASAAVGQKIKYAASLISSSLEDGFTMMNQHMSGINNNLQALSCGIGTINGSLQQGNQLLSNIGTGIEQSNLRMKQIAFGISNVNKILLYGINSVNQNLSQNFAALTANISQAIGSICYRIEQEEVVLKLILDELEMPESQRERRYHIKEGIKYYNKGISSGDCLYFEDALDEFNTAVAIERKDFLSWYFLGMIYLYSSDNLDIDRALSAFNKYIHYADALPKKHSLYEEAWIMKAECQYLMQDYELAYKSVEQFKSNNVKASLRAIKYLSASGDESNQKMAVKILEQLMQQNPYIVIQVLEDYDILSNDFVLEYIADYKIQLKKYIVNKIQAEQDCLISIKKYSTFYCNTNDILFSLMDKLSVASNDIGIIDLLSLYVEFQTINKSIEDFKQEQERIEQTTNNKKTQNKIASTYGEVWFSEGLAVVEKEDYWGFIDEKGQTIIPCIYSFAEDFHCGLAAVEDEDGTLFYIDKKGKKLVLKREYDYIESFNDGWAVVGVDKTQDTQYGVIDINGKEIISCKWKEIISVSLKEHIAEVVDFNNQNIVVKLKL